MDAIRSTAVVPPAKLTQAPPVMHTSADHKNCAYYGDSQKLYCVHGDPATGAFYSEDYIRDLRILSQGLVTSLESMFALVKKANAHLVREVGEVALYNEGDYLGPMKRTEIIQAEKMLNELKELVR